MEAAIMLFLYNFCTATPVLNVERISEFSLRLKVQHLNFIPHYVLHKLLYVQLHLFYIPMLSTWSNFQPKFSPKLGACSLS